jgi:nucleotide-binding universal stress UspA family protein
MTDLFERVLLPVASVEDAEASGRALAQHEPTAVVVVHVIEKAGGAPDKAAVEQREAEAEKMFATARAILGEIETATEYGTDVSETIFAAAQDLGASAIVVTPRGGSRWVRLLTGDVALDLVTETDRPVVVLPEIGEGDGAGEPTERASEESESATAEGGAGE